MDVSSHQTQVDLGGLMSVLGQHLYSTPSVAVRELVQNAHDSLVRRRMEQPEWTAQGRIHVSGNLSEGILQIRDTGAGLTEQEIHSFLATVGVGYTRKLRESSGSDQLIGLFGLGFLSAFVLAKEVVVTTTSYQNPHLGWKYRSLNGENYELTSVAALPEVGTLVELHLREEHLVLAGIGSLARILYKYCALLSEPIYVGEKKQPLNAVIPPWRDSEVHSKIHSIEYQQRCLDFATRFEERFEPICTIPVEPRDKSDARGILWIQNGGSYASSDNRKLSVFVRGMLLDDDARDLLPSWAGFIGGVIESSALTPTASREDLQKDDVYRELQTALKEILIEGLGKIAKQQRSTWNRILVRHNEALLGSAICDQRLFDLLSEDLLIPTSQGDFGVRSLVQSGKMHLTLGGEGGFEEMLFRALKVPVARGDRFAVVPFLRQWSQRHNVPLVELGTEEGNQQMFMTSSLPDEEMDWLREHLCDGEELIPAFFEPLELPLVIVPDREAQLRERLENQETQSRISVAALRLAKAFTDRMEGRALSKLYLNLDCPAVYSVLDAFRKGAQQAETSAKMLWSMKVILATGAEQNKLDLNRALEQMGHSLKLVAKTPTTKE